MNYLSIYSNFASDREILSEIIVVPIELQEKYPNRNRKKIMIKLEGGPERYNAPFPIPVIKVLKGLSCTLTKIKFVAC